MSTDTMKHIDNGFYRISDKLAGSLARQSPAHTDDGPSMPPNGKEWRVTHNGFRWWLSRTPYRFYTDAPARGWVWALHGKH